MECVCRVLTPSILPESVGLQRTANLYELAEGVFTLATNNGVISITHKILDKIIFTFEGRGQIQFSKRNLIL